jgi:hypothetical protein
VTPEEYRQGRRRLRELLPWARAEAKKPGAEIRGKSALYDTTAAYVTEDNLEALLIYPAPLGGWHCDVMFKDVPPAVPNCMGSPVATPFRTRAEAEDHGKWLLVSLLTIAQQPKGNGNPVFLLYGAVLRLLPEAIAAAARAEPDSVDRGYGSKEHAVNRIKETLAEVCPEGFTVDAFNKTMAREKKARLLAVLHIAALSGLFAYPPRLDQPPAAEASETRH